MANDEYRTPQQAARDAGLAARHETRVERAIRRQVAEEIALAITEAGDERSKHRHHERAAVARLGDVRHASYLDAARIAREIGSKEHSNQATEETE